mgnify:CR=1 FL=1|tara:strand:- start:2040 stop:2633 length:594 start_codon:yes stop_codon:yes gene_type:complete
MNICIVGNGPLSEENREQIKSSDLCDKVVRFNDMKNMKPEEPVDLHVVRSWGKSWWGLAEHPNKKTNYTGRPDVDVPLIVIGEARRGGQLPENKEVYKFVTRNKNKTKPGPTPRSIYDGCEFCGGSCVSNAHNFTSGAHAISLFQADTDVENIHVFGMNFTTNLKPKHQHATNEFELHSNCCTKCTIHKTPKDTYAP